MGVRTCRLAGLQFLTPGSFYFYAEWFGDTRSARPCPPSGSVARSDPPDLPAFLVRSPWPWFSDSSASAALVCSPVHSQVGSPPWTDGPGYGNDPGAPPPPVGRFFRAFEGPRGFASGSPRLRGRLIVARPRGSGVRVRPKLSSLPLPFAVSRRPARCSLQHPPVAPRRAGRCDGEAWVRRPDAGGGHPGGGRPSRRRTPEP